MDALDDIRRLIAETEQEVKKTAVKRRCWGFHTWTPWTEAVLHQRRTCVVCNKVDVGQLEICKHPTWDTRSLHGIAPNGVMVGHLAYQTCETCGIGRSVSTYVTDKH